MKVLGESSMMGESVTGELASSHVLSSHAYPPSPSRPQPKREGGEMSGGGGYHRSSGVCWAMMFILQPTLTTTRCCQYTRSIHTLPHTL